MPAARVGRKWLFRRDELERRLGHAAGPLSTVTLTISARNRLRGTVAQLNVDGLMAEVVMRIGDQELVSVITRSSAVRLGLKVGDEVLAVIKSTEIMIGKEGVE
ncbi:MAG: TOBE domain-containing protein [Candidatus Eisenbacteria bacterium]|uniref:TOBE domain-containing protein n=1 Tax=Eiseniibacteriota bacterium TaxID=2212470 RepID=A0A933SCN8_UNCEI|nr:TOBE domain-containing protein [Candidatus Eisenbacteria bacterium]